ncbi:hypothetical protein [Leptolyngbya sp. 7M]|uniref:hypothetical protein n=1 Tax=Leptolyngbya sp. 7M TaxID=2812896 RepID=UPI001B8CBD42|nr:hypothetical protein [Leptolyngbya sp. 7M]QYO65413.1 hypothetical protein JVX88_01105 [Leptolyngbya sp. 7M]
MELLIPGLILVALMVWASTKIKRDAAAAFAAERIDNERFSIDKPEGFLHVINDDSGFAFRAYSKEYGNGDAKGIRQAEIEIEIFEDSTIEERKETLANEIGAIDNEYVFIDAGRRAFRGLIPYKRNEIGFCQHFKIVQENSRVFELRAIVLAEHFESLEDDLEKAMKSFHIK